MTPLRQFKGVPSEVVRKAEGKQFPRYRYFDLVSSTCFACPPEIGELINLQNAGRLVHRLVHSFPKLQLTAHVQPSPVHCSELSYPSLPISVGMKKYTAEQRLSGF
ncbi:hypothetical protein BT96DRAFT_1073917 [Gymnopus androsaceus JB14]|uniref:Uncharacterized protein n=1 Tax=Gymnopus androsaceus JB14 TaxID=1447944 RepID=A0A6A4GRR2_9AGAR|nr:hypothetical protein BT96DRAFT_1073917 [Gymnopus androsaceus JB14]